MHEYYVTLTTDNKELLEFILSKFVDTSMIIVTKLKDSDESITTTSDIDYLFYNHINKQYEYEYSYDSEINIEPEFHFNNVILPLIKDYNYKGTTISILSEYIYTEELKERTYTL